MDWNKAKTYIILFLCLLNFFLLGASFLFSGDRQYRMSQDQLKNITEVLSKNQIRLETDIERSFQPLRELELSAGEAYDMDLLTEIFLVNPAEARFSIENNRKIYRTDWETLSINNHTVTYRNRDVAEGLPDPAEAEAACKAFIQKLSPFGARFVLDSTAQYEAGGLTYNYCQSYRNEKLYSNYVNITVSVGGISKIEFTFVRPAGYGNTRLTICAPDEALLTALYEIRNLYGNQPLSIIRMDRVYIQTDAAVEKDMAVKAVPHYRVYTSLSDFPILINAYTNSIL